jgi:ABC-type Fe3+ transport system permease subunit
MTDEEARGEARRTRRARRAAGMATSGPWQWQWRRQHRRRRTVGCMLWIVTLLAVLLVLALLLGGFQRGHKVGSTGPAGPVPASSAARSASVAGSVS